MAIANLAGHIAAAYSGPAEEFSARVMNSLKSALANPALVVSVNKPSTADGYARYLLHEDPQQRFAILALIWRQGQITPVHGHNYWCSYAVVTGTITEAYYNYQPGGKATLSNIYGRMPGYACFHEAGFNPVHRLSNQGAAEAISIHVYGTSAAEAMQRINHLVETA